MGFYLSPLVDVKEIDLSTTIPAVATSIGMITLRDTYKGPEAKKTLITDVNGLIDTFGWPTSVANCYQDILSAAGYLRYGSALYCTRAMPVSATFSGTRAPSGSLATFSAYTTANAYKLSGIASADPDDFGDLITTTGSTFLTMIANSRGAWGNNIRVATCDYATYAMIASGGYSTWDNAAPIAIGDTTNGTYAVIKGIDSPLTDTQDFLIIVSVLDQGATSWAVKEVWNVSTNYNRVDDQGKGKFVVHVINGTGGDGASKYIRVSFNANLLNTPIVTSTQVWQYFSGGQDTNDNYVTDTTTDGVIMSAIDLYANAEEVDVNILIDSNKSTTVKSYLISTCESRKDCIAILDCLDTSVKNNQNQEAESLRVYRRVTLNANSSYAALYGNWMEIYDKWNNKYRWVPPSGFVAGIFCNTDDVADPWYAPAGLNRAILANIRRLAWNPNKGYRDTLYKNGINPIVSFAGQGKVIWGQKTLLDKSSAFNRINVRRLFIVLEKAISTASKYFLFEPNDDLTRLLLVNMIDPFLRDVRSRRGIYDYMVVCDSSNNTPERIDRNELWCDIYIKPTRAAEFIVLNFICTKTGASFTELASMGA